MPFFGPWIQDPDITVQAGRARSHHDSASTLGPVTHSGAYTVADINSDVSGTTLPAVMSAVNDDAETYPSSVGLMPIGSGAAIDLFATLIPSYLVQGRITQEAMQSSAFPHGWSPPPHAQVEGGADPVVIQGHLELIHTQNVGSDRTPDFAAFADVDIYQYEMPASTIIPGTRTLVNTLAGLTYQDSGSPPTFSTVLDLVGAELNGVCISPVVRPTSGWAFSTGFQLSFDDIEIGISTAMDVANSFYVWRPPRYRLPLGTPPARRLFPRQDGLGLGIGRLWPPPNTRQSGRGIGPGSPP